MKKYKRFFEKNVDFKSIEDFIFWINSLRIPKRKPREISKVEHDGILRTLDIINDPKFQGKFVNKQALDFRDTMLKQRMSFLRLDKEEYERIYSSEQSKDQPLIIKGKYATYHKQDAGSYQRFLDNIKDTEEFLITLKGYHKIPVKNLIVKFVSNREMKVPAKWKSNENAMWINPLSKKVGNTKEEYGSLRYIILHELGHKFLDMKKQSWNIEDNKLMTTPYSQKNDMTMTGEEIFAELFALSHWERKYKQYKNQIEQFKNLIEY